MEDEDQLIVVNINSKDRHQILQKWNRLDHFHDRK